MDELDKPEPAPLSAAAQRSLDELAAALGVTTVLLRQNSSVVKASNSEVSLVEATELLEAFIKIADPRARRRCLTYVRELAAPQRSSTDRKK